MKTTLLNDDQYQKLLTDCTDLLKKLPDDVKYKIALHFIDNEIVDHTSLDESCDPREIVDSIIHCAFADLTWKYCEDSKD